MDTVNSFDEMDAYNMQTKLEDSQSHIANLLEMLAFDNHAHESASVTYMMSSMGHMLGKFSENHSEIESEMNEILESSRRGLLTHGEVADLIANEATRSYYLSNILNSLRYQIESMHEVLTEMRENAEEDNNDGDADLRLAASNLAKKMNVVLKSVTSMDRLVQSPAKKVQQAVAVIDSEVVMHVNKTQLGSNTNKADAKEKEKEKDREKAEKAAALKAAQRLPEPAVQAPLGAATPSDSARVGTGVVATTQTQTVQEDAATGQPSTTPGKPPVGGIAANVTSAKATRTVGIQANLMRGVDPTAMEVPTTTTATSPHMADHQQADSLHEQSLHCASGDDDRSLDGKSVPSTSHTARTPLGAGAQSKKGVTGSKKQGHHSKKRPVHSQKHSHVEHHDSYDSVDAPGSVSSVSSVTNSKKAGIAKAAGLPEGAEVHEALRDLSVDDIVSHVQRAQALDAMEAQLRAESELEIKRRVKVALTAAANKDYSGFALAVDSKSPHSRQTFAKYTGRPVSQDSQSGGLSININAAEFSAAPTAVNTARGADTARSVSFLASSVPDAAIELKASTLVVDTTATNQNSTGVAIAQEMSRAPKFSERSAVDASNFQPRGDAGSPAPPAVVYEAPENTYSTTQHIQYHSQQGPSPSVKPAALSSLSVLSGLEERRSNAASFRQHPASSARSSEGTVMTLRDLPENMFEPDAQARPEDHDVSHYNNNVRTDAHLSTVGGSLDTMSHWGARLPNADMAPSHSLLEGSIDMMEPFAASALLARQGGPPPHTKLLMDDSNLSESYIRSMMEQQQRSSVKEPPGGKKHSSERRAGTVTDDDMESEDFRQFTAAELQQEKEKRLSLGADGAAMPSRVELFNQIFESTKDMKKLDMIRIHAPEAARMVDSGTCTAQDKMGFPAEATATDGQTASQLLLSSWVEASSSEVMLPGRAPPGQSSLPNAPSKLRKFSDAEMLRIREALKSVVGEDAANDLLIQLEGVFIHGANTAADRRKEGGHELQIFDNQADLLVTRTYREPAPAPSFYELLSSSSNPLLHLHQEYASFLSKTHRLRLLNAAVMEDRVKLDLPQSKTIQTLLGLLLEAMLSTVAECNEMLSLVKHCENRVVSMVELLKRKPDYLGAVLASPQLAEVYSTYGHIEALEISVGMKLVEFRSLFERINAQSLHELDNLMKESTDFEYCYKHFIACQGKSVEVKQRVALLQERCRRYQLGANVKSNHFSSSQNKPSIEFDDQTSVGMQGPEQLLQDIQDLRDEVEALKGELTTAREENEDLEVEMVEMLTEKDKSPDALIFFAMMHDPSYVQNLHQLLLQMKHLKSFADGTGHMDFLTLRKRIQVCVVLTPNVEKLVDRYTTMYQKWSTFRLNWFSARKLNGGSADAFNSCPLCFQDVSAAAGGDNHPSNKVQHGQAHRAIKTLVVEGKDRLALHKETRRQKQRAVQYEQTMKQHRTTTSSLDEMSTISSPDKYRGKSTLPQIKF